MQGVETQRVRLSAPQSYNQCAVVAGIADYRGRHGNSGIGDGLPDKSEGVGMDEIIINVVELFITAE